MNFEGTYSLIEHRVQKTDYEVCEGIASHTYLQFEFIETKEDRFTLKFTKFNYKVESGTRTGRIIDFKNNRSEKTNILLDSPIPVKKNEYDTAEIPIDWFYIYQKDKSIGYTSNPSKEIIRSRKKMRKI